MVLLIDNYDSFTYNLVQALGALRPDDAIEVVRNDAASVSQLAARKPTHLVISPGPGTPRQAGISRAAIEYFSARIPVLGVCLGMQCMGEIFGGQVVRAGRLVHGKTSLVRHDGLGVFRGLDNPFQAARYHSLCVQPGSMSSELVETAWVDGGQVELMGLRHHALPMEGVQFHPESFLTPSGSKLLANFLDFG